MVATVDVIRLLVTSTALLRYNDLTLVRIGVRILDIMLVAGTFPRSITLRIAVVALECFLSVVIKQRV